MALVYSRRGYQPHSTTTGLRRIAMSMLAKFARIPSARLQQVIADPNLVTEVFDESEGSPSVTPGMFTDLVNKNDPSKNELIRRASQILTSSIRSMDPAMSELVKKSLGAAGIDPETLSKGIGGDKLIELMRQR